MQPFPGPGGKLQISTEGGTDPVWARSGEIFYRSGEKSMTVAVATNPVSLVQKPRLLFEGKYQPSYDSAADGQHFVMIEGSSQQTVPTQLTMVLNWFEELKRLVSLGKN